MGILGIMSAVTNIMEIVIVGKGRGATKKEIGVDIGHSIIEELAKRGILPAVPPKTELSDVVDAVVTTKNAEGWGKVVASTNVVLQIDDLVNAFRAGIQASASLAPKQ